ncbi:phytoene/squalene synthase family protein [Pelagibacterium halotolerans]|uniref:Phytoene synthase n=1 Tax=Pelagibacterium halotolerans (strain DSM 22347 / JCM 15775 / CGMCC 1.7692 / B2) TaxID=1082931 RepID=G4R9S8_PELHB|nr:phytoene/squalene synthase family protein [Pelagibacterium halotolerans]AEQ51485.1 Phytoene synthase [Pelagibacterium halotolerans B2]QJR18675.1 squalene/phytoene synthase family protein [Pelagibacterium halotolerans]SEA14857.1 phytoene synthase [Pelagibacterium halotolerans]
MSDSLALAADQLRELDRDRYAASLVIPAQYRAAVQSVFAFSAEIAAIRERVSEPVPGEIRLQWWVDAIEGEGHGAIASNPVADALFRTLERHELPSGPLLRLLAARRFDLYHDPMPDIGQFEGYAGETVSVLYQYAAMILAGGPVDQAADAAGHLGVAQALAGHVRAFGYNASRGQLFLPLALFAAHGVREADIYAGKDSEGLRAALAQAGELAQGHADKAAHAVAELDGSIKPAFASLALVRADIRALARQANQPFTARPAPSAFGRLWSVIWWALRNAR